MTEHPGPAMQGPPPPQPPRPQPWPPAPPPQQQRPQPSPRRGPGWGALIAGCVLCSLAGGAVAAAVTGTMLRDTSATSQQSQQANPSQPPIAQPPSQATAPPIGDGTLDWRNVAAAVSPSVVSIQVVTGSQGGAGSGVVYDAEGHILTNYHVAMGAGQDAEIFVALSDGRVFEDIEMVGLDPATDLAVLRIPNPPADLRPLPLGDSDQVVPGQPVMAVGNPLDLTDTVTTGIVSATDRPVRTQPDESSDAVITNMIQTDAAVNPGNSGGALVDATGSLIGIPSSIATVNEGNIGLGFAIPSREAGRIADQLISDGVAQHAQLGVSLGEGIATVDGQTRTGARIQDVSPGTPAEQAGLARGDVVTAIDGEYVPSAQSLTGQVRERAPGDQVTLTVVQGGQSREVTVTLATRP